MQQGQEKIVDTGYPFICRIIAEIGPPYQGALAFVYKKVKDTYIAAVAVSKNADSGLIRFELGIGLEQGQYARIFVRELTDEHRELARQAFAKNVIFEEMLESKRADAELEEKERMYMGESSESEEEEETDEEEEERDRKAARQKRVDEILEKLAKDPTYKPERRWMMDPTGRITEEWIEQAQFVPTRCKALRGIIPSPRIKNVTKCLHHYVIAPLAIKDGGLKDAAELSHNRAVPNSKLDAPIEKQYILDLGISQHDIKTPALTMVNVMEKMIGVHYMASIDSLTDAFLSSSDKLLSGEKKVFVRLPIVLFSRKLDVIWLVYDADRDYITYAEAAKAYGAYRVVKSVLDSHYPTVVVKPIFVVRHTTGISLAEFKVLLFKPIIPVFDHDIDETAATPTACLPVATLKTEPPVLRFTAPPPPAEAVPVKKPEPVVPATPAPVPAVVASPSPPVTAAPFVSTRPIRKGTFR